MHNKNYDIKTLNALFFSVVIMATISAEAQEVIQAQASQMQAQIGRDEKGYNTCGLRSVVFDEKTTDIETYDFSITLRVGAMYGLVKAGKITTSKSEFLKGTNNFKVVLPSPTKFWIVKESEGKPLLPSKYIAAENPGYILGSTEFTQTWQTIIAMMEGERMQFVLRYPKQKIDTVISFAPGLKQEEGKPLLACLDGLLERLKNEMEAKLEEK